jgi:apolipoprotein N-acyltransferase
LLDFLIIPEQTLRSIKYSTFKSELSYKYLKNIINEKKIKNIFVGISGFYTKNKLANSIAFLNNEKILLKNKNKLVPYTEFTPVFLRKMLDRYSYEFETKDSLKEIKKDLNILPLICYESIYSDYVAKNSKDADKIILIASENFLNNSYFGEIQYNNIISLRGIENGLFIIKASNCGKSITFDDNGNKIKVSENEINFFQIPKTFKLKTTFFVRFYNYYNLNIFISIGLFLLLTLKTYVYD